MFKSVEGLDKADRFRISSFHALFLHSPFAIKKTPHQFPFQNVEREKTKDGAKGVLVFLEK
jgi:hypothetical protein